MGINPDVVDFYRASAREIGKGSLPSEFRAKALDKLIDDASVAASMTGDVNRLGGYRGVGAAAGMSAQAILRQEEEKKDKSFRDFLALQDQLRRIDADIARYKEQIATLQRYHEALERHLQKLKNGEEIEKNADGSLKDHQVEEAVRAYEKKYGVTVDRDDAGQIEQVMHTHDEEQVNIRRSLAEREQQRDVIQKKVEQARKGSEVATEAHREVAQTKGEPAANSLFGKIDDDGAQAEIVAGAGLDKATEQYAVNASKGSDAALLFGGDDVVLGVANPVAKGDTKTAFASVAAPKNSDEIELTQSGPIQRATVVAPSTQNG